MAPMVSINQNDYGQMIFVPKSPKVVEKSRPRDHFRSFSTILTNLTNG